MANMLIPNNERACWSQAIRHVITGSNRFRYDGQDLYPSSYPLEHCRFYQHLSPGGSYFHDWQQVSHLKNIQIIKKTHTGCDDVYQRQSRWSSAGYCDSDKQLKVSDISFSRHLFQIKCIPLILGNSLKRKDSLDISRNWGVTIKTYHLRELARTYSRKHHLKKKSVTTLHEKENKCTPIEDQTGWRSITLLNCGLIFLYLFQGFL